MTKLHQGSGEPSLEQFSFQQLPSTEMVLTFCDLLREELDDRETHGLETQAVRHYYRKLFQPDHSLDPIGNYGYASRLTPALSALREMKLPLRLLDAGCGYGSESLLFALAGASVTGVELVSDRVELARSRRNFYQDRLSSEISVEFVNADVKRFLQEAGQFDIIWIMEAVSHIHPLEDFLLLAKQHLSPGGLLITSDPNALNPLAMYRALRIRGTLRYPLRVKGQDHATGQPVYEAVERIFSVSGYTCLLATAGFTVRQVSMSGFLGASFIPSSLHASKPVLRVLTSFQDVLRSIPILKLMGTVYTVVAQRAA